MANVIITLWFSLTTLQIPWLSLTQLKKNLVYYFLEQQNNIV